MAYDEDTAERVRKALSGRHDVVERKMMGGLCFMVKGGMCCSVSGGGGLLVRVGAQAHEMLQEPHVSPVEMRGRVMSGFVRVAAEGYRTDTTLKKWIERGLDGVTARSGSQSRKRPASHAKEMK
jgi:TfoX/Sxy family transcriptional regulator of competence genes